MNVSIIMPAYNAERTIARSIQSIISQSYTNWELLIIDDCSNDLTVSIAKDLTRNLKNNIQIIQNKINTGAGECRNIGIKKSVGEIIAFIDADDTWLKEKLKCYVQAFSERLDLALLCSHFKVNGKIIVLNNEDLKFKSLLKDNKICLSTVALRKTNIPTGQLYFQKIRKRQDFELWLRLANLGLLFSVIKKPLTIYFPQKKSLSSNKISLIKYNYISTNMVIRNKAKTLYYLFFQVFSKIWKSKIKGY